MAPRFERRRLSAQAAAQFITNTLNAGNTLARILADVLQPVSEGEVVALLPPEITDDERVYQFTTGGIVAPEDSIHELSVILQGILGPNAAYGFVVEDIAYATDPGLGEQPTLWIHYGKEVYIYVAGTHSSRSEIGKALSWARVFPLIGIVCEMPPELTAYATHKEITLDDIRFCAHHTQILVVNAYDGESFLMWSKFGALSQHVLRGPNGRF